MPQGTQQPKQARGVWTIIGTIAGVVGALFALLALIAPSRDSAVDDTLPRIESVDALEVTPKSGYVKCPIKIVFSTRVSLSGGGGIVEYRWLRDDDAVGVLETVKFNNPGTKDISTYWYRSGRSGEAVEGAMTLRIIEPTKSTSKAVRYDLICK